MKANIACIQFDSVLFDKDTNINKMKELATEAKNQTPNLDLIVFPELSLTGYECEEKYYSLAEEFPNGDSLKKMSKVAKELDLYIIFGFVEKGESKEDIYNTVALIDNNGRIIGKYRKVHLVEGVETNWFKSGDSYDVFETPFGKLGIMICWDSAFPEVARILALKGAEIIAVPSAWESPKGDDWDIVMQARSFDNVLYVAACNRVGADNTISFFGKSKIVGPLGRVISQGTDKEEIVSGEVNIAVLEDLREGYYVLLKDRRPHTYEEIVKDKK